MREPHHCWLALLASKHLRRCIPLPVSDTAPSLLPRMQSTARGLSTSVLQQREPEEREEARHMRQRLPRASLGDDSE